MKFSTFLALVIPFTGLAGCDDVVIEDERVAFEPGEELPGGDTTNDLFLGVNAFARLAANASDESDNAFFVGNSFFNQSWVASPASTTARDGLGPMFNARSCSACHFRDGRGAPPLQPGDPFVGLLFRLSVPDGVGGTKKEPTYGGQLQPLALPGVVAEGVPSMTLTPRNFVYTDGSTVTLQVPTYTLGELAFGPLQDDVMISPRVAPQMIGLGLLEAIDVADLEARADPDDVDGDGIRGVVQRSLNVQTGEIVAGRFGWKGEEPTVLQQSAGAFVNDIGITSDLFPDEICTANQPDCRAASDGTIEIPLERLLKVGIYSSILAPPIRPAAREDSIIAGKQLFNDVGCTACHVPSYVTGEHPTLPELSRQKIWPYTDLLLHDMGADLADGRPVGLANGQQWKTPPLWGIGLFPVVNRHQRLLHDGRADGVEAAILWHGGEAEAARDAFAALEANERALLVKFVESL